MFEEKKYKRIFKSFLISLPFVFTLVFLGYFPLHYDIIFHTQNIVGEGICTSYGSRVDEHISVNGVTFYFGSELKEAVIKNFYYDVDTLYLVTSDVSSYEIIDIDSYVHGIHLGHFEAKDILPEGEKIEGQKSTLTCMNNVLHVDVKDPNEGATLAITKPFIPFSFWVLYLLIIVLVTILFSIILDYILHRIPALKMPIVNAACIAVTILVGSFFCGSLSYITYVNFLLNWVILFALALFINSFTLPFIGTLFTMVFITCWYIANYFVIILRGKPIMPADLKAAGTAAEVMGGYTFIPSWKMIVGILIIILYIIFLINTWKEVKENYVGSKAKMLWRGVSIAVAAILIFCGINTSTFKNLNSFAWDTVLMKSFHEEGMVLTYIKSALNSQVKKPDGYSREVVNKYLEEYSKNDLETDKGVRPTRIIMVMNEAFSDLRTVGLNNQIDVMPFIDSLDKNTVEGSLYVSIFGGGTCNTEFEALTGNTLAFLGAGAYPYTENITKPLFSLASYYRNLGYLSDAFHANEADNWNRNMVYPFLGFQNFHSIKDYEENGFTTELHDNPADISDYLYIEKVDEDQSESPRFLFNVTMQNHSPYERWLDVQKADSVDKDGNDLYVDAQVYLSLIKASDDEIQQLINTYEDDAEPTMIVFFGDHQPGLPSTAINDIYTSTHANIDLYKTKFFIWTNYETKEWHNAGISANYLPWLILERGNFPLPPYIQMLKELYEHYPIISSQGVMDINGNIYSGVAEVMDDPLIKKYQYIQYANLFDEIDPAWFEVPSTK